MKTFRGFVLVGAAVATFLGLAAPALAASDTKGCDYTFGRGTGSAIKLRVIATTNISCPNAVRSTIGSLESCSRSVSFDASAARKRKPRPTTFTSRCKHNGYQCRMRMTVKDKFSELLDGALGIASPSKRARAAGNVEFIRTRMTVHCMKGPKRRFGTTVAFAMGFYFKQLPTLR